ncbi:glycosyltransferase family 1 protein [Microbacterium sp. ARD31]|uniref:glycosyltransferase family 4 protein n=1 Tax=Microbacterium sp. ARD31 TaxID=2962576 RepID=UPI0028812CF5|nr:glycosyltransferase family 1 protein [Microbacterium sp. ARD31]MDT0186483.1 glycosyltransferase family 1 protein [Microbacterium sp. ARD31]
MADDDWSIDVSEDGLVVNCRFLTRPVTGVERFAYEITARLVESVPDITLVAPPDIEPGTRVRGKTVEPVGRLRGHLWEQVSLPGYLRSLGSPTLVDLANTGPLLWRKQLYTLHDVAFITHPESYRPLFRLMYRVIAGTLIRRAAHVATVSTFSRDEIIRTLRCPPDRITVVPNGVSTLGSATARIRTPPLDGRAYFLAVGSAARHKNTAMLLDAYARFRIEQVDAPALVIVGGDSKGFRPTATADDRPGVIALGRVTDDELAGLYANAMAFVYPSLYEGFGIPPLEAQSVGTPVIVSRRRPFTDLLQESSAVWCDPEDAASITSALAHVSRSPELREQLIKNGSMNASRYSWDDSAKRVLAIVAGSARKG